MGKHRIARSVRRGVLVAAVVALGLIAWTPVASAAGISDVTPIIDHACLTPTPAQPGNLDTVWGYTNTNPDPAGVTVTYGDPGDDQPPAIDEGGDNDDNFFYPTSSLSGNLGQPTHFGPGTTHNAITTTNAPPGLLWNIGANSLTSSAPKNCADLAVTKTQAVDTVTTGSLQQYTVTVTKSATNGGSPAAGFSVTDTLSSNSVSGVTATSSVGTCTVAVPTITCSSPADLAPGASVSIVISLTPTSGTSLSDQATVSSATFDPDLSNNTSALVTTALGAPGGPSGGGILNTGQQLTVADTAVKGTVKVTTGTLALTTDVAPCPTTGVTFTCQSEALNMEPHGTPNGQIVTEVFDSGRPSPFIPIWKVKFFYFKDDLINHPLPLCPHYLVPKPGPGGNLCEYFRWMDLHGHAIVYLAVGANDARTHR